MFKLVIYEELPNSNNHVLMKLRPYLFNSLTALLKLQRVLNKSIVIHHIILYFFLFNI